MSTPTKHGRREVLAGAAALALLQRAGAARPATQETGGAAGAAPVDARTAILVRHTEKAIGDTNDPTLSEPGVERAAALARALGALGVTHLFSSRYKRTRLTLAPLAEAAGIAVDEYDAGDLPALAARLRALAPGSVAVVAGHSNTTPKLAALLGGKLGDLEPRGYFHDDAYDRLIVQTLAACGDARPNAIATLDLRYGA